MIATRRNLLGCAAALLALSALRARGNSPAAPKAGSRRARVLWFHDSLPEAVRTRIRDGFAAHRLHDGRDIALTFRTDEDKASLEEVVASRPDTIVMSGTYRLVELAKLTRDIPVVFYNMSLDPVSMGLVETLRRPGGNFTGTLIQWDLITTKYWQLLKELRPAMKRGGVLVAQEHLAESPGFFVEMQRRRWRAAAEGLGIDIREVVVPLQAPASVVVAAVREAGVEALQLGYRVTPEVASSLGRAAIPTAGYSFGNVRRGLQMLGISFEWDEGESHAISMVARVLRGESPATMPVYQTRQYGIAVNLKLAREAGIEIPPSILIQAVEVVR